MHQNKPDTDTGLHSNDKFALFQCADHAYSTLTALLP